MRILLPLIFCFAVGVLLAGPAAASPRSLRDAVEQVQRDIGGKILSAELVRVGRTKVYRIKVLTADGKVRVVQLPAEEK